MSDKSNLISQQLPQIHRTSIVAQSRLFKIEEMHLEFSNGATRVYERLAGSGRGAVMIVPMKNAEEFFLVSEYGAGAHKYDLGFPKGLIDPGETPEQAANRELKEEIGFGAKTLVELKTLSIGSSFLSSKMHIFLAFDLYPETLEGDEPEPLIVHTWAWQNADELLQQSEFSEARSVSALYMAQQWLANKQNTQNKE
ncbi:MAG: ADP compounds hydrolase NudE [Gammaproteobacteria bacterium]|nr:ADP compounds hydrolase NudE [Gammaproteobacteria bacterium]